MLKKLPCGCVPTQLNNKKEAKELMLSGEVIWFDYHNESYGFMKYYGGKVFSIVWVDETHREGVFTLKKANKLLDEYEKDGYDFSYGEVDIDVDVETGTLSILCDNHEEEINMIEPISEEQFSILTKSGIRTLIDLPKYSLIDNIDNESYFIISYTEITYQIDLKTAYDLLAMYVCKEVSDEYLNEYIEELLEENN